MTATVTSPVTLGLDKSTWNRVQFGDVIQNVSERVDDPATAGVDRYVGLEHLDSGSMTVTRWGTPAQVSAQKLRFHPGDVIFGRRRAYQKKVSRANFEGICSAHALVLRAFPDKMDPDFLPVFLSSDHFLNRAIAISVGSLSPTVNWRDLKVQEFLLPPLAEQARIAHLSWAIDGHLGALLGVVASTTPAYEAWLDRRLSSEPTRGLGDVVRLQHGRPVPSDLYGDVGVPLLRPGDMKPDGHVRWTDSSVRIPQSFAGINSDWLLAPGDLVINMTAQSLEDRFLGRVCRMHDSALLNQRIGRLTPVRDASTEFLHVALRARSFADWVARRSEGSKVKHMHWRHIDDYPLPLPSARAQSEIVAQASAWTRAIDSMSNEITSLSDLRRIVMQDAFGAQE